MGLFPYADRYPVVRSFPLRGRPRNEIVAEIEAMSAEDAVALEGKISGSIYSGDEAHYAFLNEVFGHCSHANVLQRDVYPSATRFEGEIIAMTADLMHAPEAVGVTPAPPPAPRPGELCRSRHAQPVEINSNRLRSPRSARALACPGELCRCRLVEPVVRDSDRLIALPGAGRIRGIAVVGWNVAVGG